MFDSNIEGYLKKLLGLLLCLIVKKKLYSKKRFITIISIKTYNFNIIINSKSDYTFHFFLFHFFLKMELIPMNDFPFLQKKIILYKIDDPLMTFDTWIEHVLIDLQKSRRNNRLCSI